MKLALMMPLCPPPVSGHCIVFALILTFLSHHVHHSYNNNRPQCPLPPWNHQEEVDNLVNRLGNLNLYQAMFIYHFFDWYKGVAHEDVLGGINERLHSLTLDVLLPGPTQIGQIEVTIPEDGKTLILKYTPPVTYLSANRTAARIAHGRGAVDDAAIHTLINPLRAMNRVQAHQQALLAIRREQAQLTINIPLPFAIDLLPR
jgi:hypothetical protein